MTHRAGNPTIIGTGEGDAREGSLRHRTHHVPDLAAIGRPQDSAWVGDRAHAPAVAGREEVDGPCRHRRWQLLNPGRAAVTGPQQRTRPHRPNHGATARVGSSRKGNWPVLLRTDDGGRRWVASILPRAANAFFGNHIFFLNAAQGWLLSGGAVWHTSDGGTSWTGLSS